jgi:uncharacterized protein
MKAVLSIAAFFLLTMGTAHALGETPDARNYPGPAWSPYLAGGLIGVLAWFTMLFSNKPVGASSAYATAAGLLGKAAAPRHTKSWKYYQDNPPKVDWELVFLAAVILGAFLAAWHGGELTQRWLPSFWEARFGEGSIALRAIVAFVGGVLMAFGARMAGGCTSGHGISGTLQLNVASWIALICFFIGGALVANLIYRL